MAKSRYQDYLVYDLETGGLPGKDAPAFDTIALTEVALVYVSPQLEIIGKTSFLLKPYKEQLRYDAKASEVSGITMDMLEKDGIGLEEAFGIVVDFINTYQTGSAKPRLVGHNIKKFDNPFMENWFKFMESNLYKFVHVESEDTLEWAHRLFLEAPDYKLGTMCDQFDIEITQSHRALPDTIGNALLWIEIMKRLRGEAIASTVTTAEQEQTIIDKLNKFQF